MSYIEKLLARNEAIVRTTRKHWITLLGTALVDLAVSVVIVGLSVLGVILSPPWTWFALLLLLVPLGHFLWRLWVWGNHKYVVTSRRILQVTGTYDKRVSDTPLDKINDIVMRQSALGRLLKFGDLEIISGSEMGADIFERIADPVGFKKALLEQQDVRTSGGRSEAPQDPNSERVVTDQIPELIAELDDLRRQGLITEEEFQEKKRELLARIK